MGDVVIIGNGVVGLALAHVLSGLGIAVRVVAQVVPAAAHAPSPQVYALNHASKHLLHCIGVWPSIAPWVQPYNEVLVWDGQTGDALSFDSNMAKALPLGHIVSVPALRMALWEALRLKPLVTLHVPCETQALHLGDNGVVLSTDQGDLHAQLLVGADGARSWVRDQLQASSQQWSSHQTAITAVVQSEGSHGAVARQVFLPTGPLALLPSDPQNQQVMVWSLDDHEVQKLLQYSPEALGKAATAAVGGCLGRLRVVGAVQHFPLLNQHVAKYVHGRAVLVGDAAHRIHPLAGQGANLGLADVALLAQVLGDAKRGGLALNNPVLLARFERKRRLANARMLWACDALRRCFAWQDLRGLGLRSLGFRGLASSRWLRQKMLKQALG